jgi:hypothetical protein
MIPSTSGGDEVNNEENILYKDGGRCNNGETILYEGETNNRENIICFLYGFPHLHLH